MVSCSVIKSGEKEEEGGGMFRVMEFARLRYHYKC